MSRLIPRTAAVALAVAACASLWCVPGVAADAKASGKRAQPHKVSPYVVAMRRDMAANGGAQAAGPARVSPLTSQRTHRVQSFAKPSIK